MEKSTLQSAFENFEALRIKACNAYLHGTDTATVAADIQFYISVLFQAASIPGISNTLKTHYKCYCIAYKSILSLAMRRPLPRAELSG